MTIAAIYFKDKDCIHLKIKDKYNAPDHLLINGKAVKISGLEDTDFTIEGREVKVQGAHKNTKISHYIHRENEELMSVMDYDERMKSFRNTGGEYKDLESEYMSRKMQQTYVPVYLTYYEYEDMPVFFEEAYFQPDEYTQCGGWIKKNDDDKYPKHFVYRFNRWKFCNDLLPRLMEEYGIPRIETTKDNTLKEYYILYNKEKAYKWLEFCGREYFIRYEDMFSRDSNKQDYVYGAYDEVKSFQESIENKLRQQIDAQLDRVRTVNIKKSELAELEERLNKLETSIDNKKKARWSIANDIHNIRFEFRKYLK